jgi:hypothetical protein
MRRKRNRADWFAQAPSSPIERSRRVEILRAFLRPVFCSYLTPHRRELDNYQPEAWLPELT